MLSGIAVATRGSSCADHVVPLVTAPPDANTVPLTAVIDTLILPTPLVPQSPDSETGAEACRRQMNTMSMRNGKETNGGE